MHCEWKETLLLISSLSLFLRLMLIPGNKSLLQDLNLLSSPALPFSAVNVHDSWMAKAWKSRIEQLEESESADKHTLTHTPAQKASDAHAPIHSLAV